MRPAPNADAHSRHRQRSRRSRAATNPRSSNAPPSQAPIAPQPNPRPAGQCSMGRTRTRRHWAQALPLGLPPKACEDWEEVVTVAHHRGSQANLIPGGRRGNGWIQKRVRRYLRRHQQASTSELTEICYPVRLASIAGENAAKRATFRNRMRSSLWGSLKSIGAQRISRASTKGNPWIWTIKLMGPNMGTNRSPR